MTGNTSGRMTRKDFVRRVGMGAAAVGAVAIGLGRTARADWPDTSGNVVPDGVGGFVVYPADDPAQDVMHIQEAVDAAAPGRTVKLMPYAKDTNIFRRFDFGPGTVMINKEVNVVGVSDQSGSKPEIFSDPAGGAINGIFVCGHPAQAGRMKGKIQNIHFNAQPSNYSLLYSAIMIFQSEGVEVSNCKITMATENSFIGFGIWYYFSTSPPSGEQKAANNEIYVSRATPYTNPDTDMWVIGGIGYGNFLTDPSPPVLIDSNFISCRNCWGWFSGAIVLHGNVSNGVVSNNTGTGVNNEEAVMCLEANPSSGVQMFGNDFSTYEAIYFQLYVGQTYSGCSFVSNNFGPSVWTGAYVLGNQNHFTNQNFMGNYPGWSQGSGCLYLEYGTQDNQITALKNGVVLNGFAVCDQVYDVNYEATGQTTNTAPGLVKCARKDAEFLQSMKAKADEITARREQRRLGRWGSLYQPGRQ
jgi:hypothetical protein